MLENKNKIEVLVGKLMTNKILEKPWTHLIVDLITKLLLVAGKNTILVAYNKLSKMTHFVATTKGILAEKLMRLFRNNMWKLHRLSESVISNKRLQFVVELTKELNRMLGIEMRLSIAFHLQTDRQTEQINQELEQYLRFFIEYRQRDWLEQLVIAEFAVNNKVHSATKILWQIIEEN